MGIDITDKIISEQKIVNQAAKLNAVFDGSSHYIWTIDGDSKLTSFNKNYVELIMRTYRAEPKIGMCINAEPFVSSEEYNGWWTEQIKKALTGERLNFETVFTDEDKNKIYLDVYLNPIYHENKIIEVSGIAHDITERVHNEEKVHQSLKEKEVLLKEVHHRVKNNMQVISSILNLQSSYVTDQYALSLLKESQNRIKTMAYIHESLYQNKTFTSINFSDYISTLTNNILQSYAASIQSVKLDLNIQKIILNLDTSIPAGLIINELVTNSIKHAFTESNEGIILINLHTKDNVLFLEVSDNGKGFPKDIDFKNTNSLGLQLVNTLVEQLNGKMELNENNKGGTSFYINFPM
jgi:PAS domain S-box-containing protein